MQQQESKTEEEKKALHVLLPLVTAAFGVACLVLVSVAIVLSWTVATAAQNHQNATAWSLQLRRERDDLRRRTEELSRERDGLNWTIGVIFQYQTFPVNTHCPGRVCRTCLDGWRHFQSSCYLFTASEYSTGWNSWWRSRGHCRTMDADLVVIESSTEQEFINNHTKAYNDEEHGYWIGLSNDEGSWTWVDGSNVTLKFWTEDQGFRTSCALSLPPADPQANWKKSSCYMMNRWICEARALNKQTD